jgi:hypothetical protein
LTCSYLCFTQLHFVSCLLLGQEQNTTVRRWCGGILLLIWWYFIWLGSLFMEFKIWLILFFCWGNNPWKSLSRKSCEFK